MACGSLPNSVWGKTTPCCMGSLLVRSVMVSGWRAQTVACVGPSGARRLHRVHAQGIRRWTTKRSYHRCIGASRHSLSKWVGGCPASMTVSPLPIDADAQAIDGGAITDLRIHAGDILAP